MEGKAIEATHLKRLFLVVIHSTWSSLQLVHGLPMAATSQRIFRDLQVVHACEALFRVL